MRTLSPEQRLVVTQFLRYACVGVMNTLITLVLIFLCKSIFGINPWVSNAIGYVAGFVNSFVWNKLWVFKSGSGVLSEGVKFIIGFLLCYAFQFAATWLLTEQTPLGDIQLHLLGFTMSGYGLATLIGMVVYTLANFVYNRTVTFKGAGN